MFPPHGDRSGGDESPSVEPRTADDQATDADQATESTPPVGRRWPRRLRSAALLVAILGIIGAVGAVGTAYVIATELEGNVRRVDGAFEGLDPTARPAKNPQTPSSRTILAVGSDIRSDAQTTGRDAAVDSRSSNQRTDTIMLIRFAPEQGSASVVSIPRDSWVPIPGRGHHKINAAYSLGGPQLLIRTVEQLTGVRVDNFMIIDFAGFESIVDAIGGVQVQVAKAVTGPDQVHFRQGINKLNGKQALAYVRQRHGLPGGDLDRVRRQQNVLRAMLIKISTMKPGADPRRTYRLLDAITRAVTIDDSLTADNLRLLALDAIGLNRENVWFLTAGVRGGGWEGRQSVIYLDDKHNSRLWQALRDDSMADYIAEDRAGLLQAVPH